jgi:hypothetical protein
LLQKNLISAHQKYAQTKNNHQTLDYSQTTRFSKTSQTNKKVSSPARKAQRGMIFSFAQQHSPALINNPEKTVKGDKIFKI